MNPFKKTLRIIYPLIIWLGTVMLPLLTVAIFVLVAASTTDKPDKDFWVIFGIIALIAFAYSLPAFILFCITYAICLFTKLSKRTTKLILLAVNFINIVGSIGYTANEFASGSDLHFLMEILGASLVLLIPSTALILLIKIPQKKID